MTAPSDLTLQRGWCEVWTNRGRVSVGLGDGTQGERGQHVYLDMEPDEADVLTKMLSDAARKARRVGS